MQWFDRWFFRKWQWAYDNRDSIEQSKRTELKLQTVEESPSWQDGLRMNVKKVIGGFVVSFRTYDRKTDRSDDRNYIITDEQDFNAELGKMITMESMRQS